MRWLKWIAAATVVLILAVVLSIPRLNDFQSGGRVTLAGLKEEVRVVRDEKGMAYIHAADENDLIRAQGFVTAQDRLFPMQLTRLFATGRIAELAGEKGKKSDILMRTIGFGRQARKHEKLLDERTRGLFQNYVDGVNAFIAAGKDLPLEFRLAGIKAEPWTIADSLAIVYYMGWNSAANLKTEAIAQMLAEKLGEPRARELFPLNINPDDAIPAVKPKRTGLAVRPRLNLAGDAQMTDLLRETEGSLRIGSNNWVTGGSLSQGGKPILANDPHLDPRILPGPWYPTGLITPQVRAVGVTVAGVPGMVIGRTDRIAVGVTNAYGDAQDLYVETIDPANPANYLEGRKSVPFEMVGETLRIKDGKAPGGFREERIAIRLTRRGPVVTGILPELKSQRVVTVRWSPFETMQPSLGLDRILTARSAGEVRAAISEITTVMLNFVFADVDGRIGWQTSGRLPIRSRGDGTLPYVVTDDRDNWSGWIPYEKMPGSADPPRGWVGTCNHFTVRGDYPYYYSSYASPSYRYRRLAEVLDKPGKRSVDDHWALQRDDMNVMAREIAPVMAQALLRHPETAELGKILEKWDFRERADLAAPMIFHKIYERFALEVFRDELGEELARAMLGDWYFWQERLQRMVREGESSWFDDQGTPAKEGRDDLFLRAALAVTAEAKADGSGEPAKWTWGERHRITFVSPLRREGVGSAFLGGGAHPMDGSQETLYRASYDFNRPYDVTLSASLRMVADLGDNDKILAVLPGGVSGRQFTGHYRDQVEPFMNGEKRYWWFSDREIANHAKTEQTLVPR
ncbi:MAG: penicillin acylase family protein [Deltaproteobacteria bacterium]|nr:penicillin acylase family protein [Deltaproteobacteria bacterium]